MKNRDFQDVHLQFEATHQKSKYTQYLLDRNKIQMMTPIQKKNVGLDALTAAEFPILSERRLFNRQRH